MQKPGLRSHSKHKLCYEEMNIDDKVFIIQKEIRFHRSQIICDEVLPRIHLP